MPKPGPVDWMLAQSGHALLLTAGAVGFWIAYDDGSYDLLSRTTLAVLVWWMLILGTAIGVLELPSPAQPLLPAALLGAFAVWALVSVTWSSSSENAFNEFNRATLYVGILTLGTLVRGRRARECLVDAMTLAVVGIALVALGSRLFPDAFTQRNAVLLPAAVTRLSFPLGYWNGLAIFVALGIPLLLRASMLARSLVWRSAAVAIVPVVGCVVFLASSRGGVVTGIIGGGCFLALSARRWSALAALCAGGISTAVSVGVLLDRPQLVNGPIGSATAHDQGRSAAILIALSCVGAGALYAVSIRLLRTRMPPFPGRYALTVFAAVVLVITIVVAHPVRRFEEFKALPQQPVATSDFVRAHLASGSGSGRWQFWMSALDEWGRHPVEGGGAGSFERWWAQHGSLPYFVRDAHSVYLETLAEVGLVGLGLFALFVASCAVYGVRALRRGSADSRVTAAALFALVAAYLVAAGLDWMWELTAVTALGTFALGLLLASSAASERSGSGLRLTSAARAALIMAGVAVIVAQAIPMFAQVQIGNSQAAVERGDLQAATNDALRARVIQPWAASPYLQLALTAELDGRLRDAHRWIRSALSRDEGDWRLWLVAARIETKLAMPQSASKSLRRADALNPRSPLFESIRVSSR